MDPFISLPSEVRSQILLEVQSKRATMNLIKSSPVMLQEYFMQKTYIARQSLPADLDDAMVQDAMFILLCPGKSWLTPSFINEFDTISSLFALWKEQKLPNPIHENHKSHLSALNELHGRLLFFIEDYITKSTAVYPPREFLCLFDTSLTGCLTFKGRKVAERFDAESLTGPERRRLFRAFLRYELICKVCQCRDIPLPAARECGEDGALRQYEGRRHERVDKESLFCVQSYIESLYCALAAHCYHFRLPDVPRDSQTEATDLLYPDNFYVNYRVYGGDRVQFHTGHGLGLIAHLIQVAMSESHVHGFREGAFEASLKRLTSDLTTAWPLTLEPHLPWAHSMSGETSTRDQGPGLYRTLDVDVSDLMLSVYRQRAWVFLENDRLFPRDTPIPLFPTRFDFAIQFAKAEGVKGYSRGKGAARERRRLQAGLGEQGKECAGEESEERVRYSRSYPSQWWSLAYFRP